MEDLFKGQKLQKEAPVLEKIAVYRPYYPPGIPIPELTEFLKTAPQVQVSASHLWLQTPQGLSLFFDPSAQSWQLQHVDYEKWFGRLNPSIRFSEISYRVNRLESDLQLKALVKSEMLLIAENHKIKFWMTKNNQVVVPPVQNDIYTWFYLGKCLSDSETYLFFAAYEKKLYFLGSTIIREYDYDYDSDIDIKPYLKQTMKVNFVGKPDEHSLVLGFNPNEVNVNTIPKLEAIESLGLVLSSDLPFTFSLANKTTPFYSTLLYQVSDKQTNTLVLSDSGPWMASKINTTTNKEINREALVIFNEVQQLIFPLNSENNTFIQVSHGHGAERQTYHKSLQAIRQRAEQSVEPIFIFNAWKVANGLSFNDSLEAKVGHYQQETLGVNVAAMQLSQADAAPSQAEFSIKDWPAWLGGGLSFVGFGLGGYCAWLLRRRVGHAGYNGAKVVSLGMGGTVLEFNSAHAQAVEPMLLGGGDRVEQEALDSKPVLAANETQSANIPEITGSDLEYFAGGFWKNTLPLVGLLSEKFSKQREARYRKVDFIRRVRISQLEEQEVKLEVKHLVDRLLQPWESELEAKITVNDVISQLSKHLWEAPYKDYLPQDMLASELNEEILACFESSRRTTVADLRLFLTKLFVEKVYEKVKANRFSPIKELSDKQKAVFMKIMPVICQTEEEFVASLGLVAKPMHESTKGLCGFIQSGFNFFKSIVKITNSQSTSYHDKINPSLD